MVRSMKYNGDPEIDFTKMPSGFLIKVPKQFSEGEAEKWKAQQT